MRCKLLAYHVYSGRQDVTAGHVHPPEEVRGKKKEERKERGREMRGRD